MLKIAKRFYCRSMTTFIFYPNAGGCRHSQKAKKMIGK